MDRDAVRAFTSFGNELIERLERYSSHAQMEKE
jgi:hypothetical protein